MRKFLNYIRSMPRRRQVILACFIIFVIYFISFFFIMRVPQGTVGVSDGPNVQKAIPIYLNAHNESLNKILGIIYYPLIMVGESTGVIRYYELADDDSCEMPTLFMYILYQLSI